MKWLEHVARTWEIRSRCKNYDLKRAGCSARPSSKSEHIELYLEERAYEVSRCTAF